MAHPLSTMFRAGLARGSVVSLVLALASGCSSGEASSDEETSGQSQGGNGGEGGQGGGGSSQGGGAGAAGKAAGGTGASAGAGGQGGSSGKGGSSGQAGAGGSAGKGGSSGASGKGGSSGASGSAGSSGASGQGGSSASAGAGGSAGAGTAGSAGSAGSTQLPVCDCLLGEGPYCGGRAAAEADKAGCSIPALAGHKNDLLKCDNGKWSLLEDCAGSCTYDGSSQKLDDACKLPVCECFVQEAYCGSGAAKVAAQMNCAIPLLPEHNGDILYCPGGVWTVKKDCNLGCVEAPSGTADYCKSSSDYHVPYDCNTTRTCSNGNHTSTHTGKDEYAYDWAMPIGTTVRAMRGGKVLRVRNVSPAGSFCYNSGSSSCINSANTVEVLHSDGTVGLYMHLSKGTVSAGQQISQGDVIGKSGNSGWSTGPHTHVQVQQNCGIWWCQSLPFKFVEDSTVSAGTSVKSKNCP